MGKKPTLAIGAVALVIASAIALWAARPIANPPVPRVSLPARVGSSPAVRDIIPRPPIPGPPRVIPDKVHFVPPGKGPAVAGPDPVRQTSAEPTVGASATPAPGLSFEGTSDDDNAALLGFRVVPPDTEGDVGPNHYVQMNNLVFQIFNKDGSTAAGPLANNSVWQGFGGVCEGNNDGDPIVLYDQGADRWILSQIAVDEDGHQCIAVSKTGDPTGEYHLYDFVVSPKCVNDYPKLTVWPDAYYLTANEFCLRGPFRYRFKNPIAVAFEKAQMLNGNSAQMVKFDVTSSDGTPFSVQPSHWEGPTPPAPNTPNTFVMAFDDETWGSGSNPDGYRLWEFSVDWNNTGNSTFTALGQVDTTEFDSNLCNFNSCVPQPNPGENLDTLSQFTMFRAQYRYFDTHDSIVVNHTVDADGNNTAGVRWAELRNTGSGWSIYQTGTLAPDDGEHRWMGSIAMDGSGNIAVAYSASSTGTYPSVRYASRAAGDPLGELSGGEVECYAGSGSQTNSSNRWGDYSTISVDPTDDCTFWLTNEYYEGTGSFDFKSRVCAFSLPECTGTVSCTITEGSEVSCSDGIDNDCNGYVDCADSNCSTDPACVGPCGDGMCDAGSGEDQCTCSTDCGPPPGTETGLCSDGVDNDCDGFVDVDDSDCPCPDSDGDSFTDSACGGTDCNDSDANIFPGATEICTDLIDNDCDALIDCNDSDCSSDSACTVSCFSEGLSCSSDSECCSNKCRGRPGGKTCK